MPDSTRKRCFRKGANRPKKHYPGYPLTPHPSDALLHFNEIGAGMEIAATMRPVAPTVGVIVCTPRVP
jgi:hypothetical protein